VTNTQAYCTTMFTNVILVLQMLRGLGLDIGVLDSIVDSSATKIDQAIAYCAGAYPLTATFTNIILDVQVWT